ncbi:hypothetical protein GLOIN_2v1779027 [Rhizophagus clarus]|uniref:Uncharacterized protein n=1 Tax=Rhizophagus clarus TaxID=94130 RepID=A0A8H3KV35_9GLOM|nr:hypothetical protein GLOIN_2v1779027 [Rhizophagus clarus]
MLSETATSYERAEFFKKFVIVKNTKASTNNWVKSLEKFRREIDVDIQQQYLFPNLWKVFNGKIKFLSDLGLNESQGSDALNADEVAQILNHQKMDGSTPGSNISLKRSNVNSVQRNREQTNDLLNAKDGIISI